MVTGGGGGYDAGSVGQRRQAGRRPPGLTRAILKIDSGVGAADLRRRGRWGVEVVTKNSGVKPSGVVSRFVRRVCNASGAVAVQIVTRRGWQVEQVEHLGSARTDADLAVSEMPVRFPRSNRV
jgi:hypothetical protein